MNKPTPTPKYRPSLTASQLTYILQLAKNDYAQLASQQALDLISILHPFLAKIEVGAVAVSHTATPIKRDSFETAITYNKSVSNYPAEFTSKEEYWGHCYDLYANATPNLTIAELQAAKEHMYLNDMMTEEEIAEYEKLDIASML